MRTVAVNTSTAVSKNALAFLQRTESRREKVRHAGWHDQLPPIPCLGAPPGDARVGVVRRRSVAADSRRFGRGPRRVRGFGHTEALLLVPGRLVCIWSTAEPLLRDAR